MLEVFLPMCSLTAHSSHSNAQQAHNVVKCSCVGFVCANFSLVLFQVLPQRRNASNEEG